MTTPTREQVIKWAREAGGTVLRYDTEPTFCCSFTIADLEKFSNALFATGQQAEREKLERVAFLDLAKLSNGMAYATSFKTNEKQTDLYRIREEQ